MEETKNQYCSRNKNSYEATVHRRLLNLDCMYMKFYEEVMIEFCKIEKLVIKNFLTSKLLSLIQTHLFYLHFDTIPYNYYIASRMFL